MASGASSPRGEAIVELEERLERMEDRWGDPQRLDHKEPKCSAKTIATSRRAITPS